MEWNDTGGKWHPSKIKCIASMAIDMFHSEYLKNVLSFVNYITFSAMSEEEKERLKSKLISNFSEPVPQVHVYFDINIY